MAAMSSYRHVTHAGTSGWNGSRYAFFQVADDTPKVRPWKLRMAPTMPDASRSHPGELDCRFLRLRAHQLQRKLRSMPSGADLAPSRQNQRALVVVEDLGQEIIVAAWRLIAATMSGWAWPRFAAP